MSASEPRLSPATAARRPVKVAFADASDERVLAAVELLAADGDIVPVLVAPASSPVPPEVQVVRVESASDQLTALAQLVSATDIAAGVAGSLSSSASVIRAGIKTLGTKGLVTGCFMMERSGRLTTYADCSVVPDPSAEQLATIAALAADHHAECTGEMPRVAMLSFSTNGSAEHPAVAKVRQATALLHERRPDLEVEGELQFDAAVDVVVGQRKFPGSEVAGHANVLIFPTLDAGNIAYKVAERLGGARALGSFVLNLTKPWVDLSRGCTVDDLVDTVRLVARLSSTASKGSPAT